MDNNYGYIIHKIGHKKGKRYDYIFTHIKRTVPSLPKRLLMYLTLDTPLGLEKDFPAEQLSSTPIRKKRNLELSSEEKEYNKNHSKKKILIEHTISVD